MHVLWILIFLFADFCWAQVAANRNEEVLFQKSMQLYQKNDLVGCTKGFSQLLRMNRRKALYWFNLGNCFSMSGQYAKAQSCYSNVVKLKSPLSPAAKLYRAQALSKLGRTEEAQDLLRELKNQTLPPALKAEVAMALYQQGMYVEAEEQMKQDLQAADSKTQLLLGLTLMKQNKNQEAEKVLQPLSASTGLSESDRTLVAELLETLKTFTAEKPYWFFIDLAYGSTTNAYLDGRSLAPVSSPLLRASVGTGYQFSKSPAWSSRVSYVFDYESPTNVPDLKTQTHSFQVPTVYQNRKVELGFVPYAQAQIWGSTMASHKYGGLVRSATLGNGLGGGCDVDMSSQKGANDNYAYLTGTSYSVRPFVSWTRRSLMGQLYWFMGSDGTQDIIYSDGSRLPLQNNYQGPGVRLLWKTSASSSLLLQAHYLERNFKNNSLPEDKHRKDQELISSIKYVYAFSRNWMAYALAEYIPNKSTLGSEDVRDKNYDNLNLLAGVAWDVF